ncbi:Nuclear cap-binding protein subunit 1, partial [Linum perenne]
RGQTVILTKLRYLEFPILHLFSENGHSSYNNTEHIKPCSATSISPLTSFSDGRNWEQRMSSWRSLLLRIGEKCPEYGGNADFKDHIFLLQCAEQLPHKVPLYGTVIGLLNLENEEFVKGVVETTQTHFQEGLDSGSCDRIRVLLRFLTALMCSKVLQPASLVVVFETLLSSAATTLDEEKGNPSWQARGDFFVTCILSCLPWGGSELAEQVPEEIERVMVGMEAYLSIRRHNSDIGLSFFEDDDDSNAGEKDFLEDLWDRIKALSTNGWKVDSVPRPHLAFEAQLVSGKAHELGCINAPEQPDPLPQPMGIAYGREKHIAELSRKECASSMVGLPVPFRYEYLMAETIFAQLLLLPQPPFNPLYYTLVIMDLCKALPGAFPAVVAGAVRALFEKISDLDMECRTRLILWFSHHLSNFQFIWPWEEWAFVLDLPKWAPQRVFVQEVLEREVRLSYWDKVKQSVENAPALEELLPPKGSPNFKYSVEDGKEKTECHAVSAELSNKVKGRASAREVISWVEETVLTNHGWEVTLSVIVQTLLDIGSKSFTHLITVLERYGQVIARLCPDLDKQVLLIAEILRNAISKTYNRMSDLRKEVSSLKKNVLITEEAAARAKAELDAAESNLTLMNGEPVLGDNPVKMKRLKSHAEKSKEEAESVRDSLEAKEALLARATVENEELFLALYKNFSDVLRERLPDASKAQTLRDLKSTQTDEMALDIDQPSTMEVDEENGNTKKSQSNGESGSSVYNIGEKEQWCLSTLGYIKSLSRQYASEVWSHIEKLDAEVLTQDVHPLFRRAVYSGLRRPIDEVSSV